MFKLDFTFTKRQFGIICLLTGSLAFAAILSIDLINAGREGGIGPAQRIALIVSVIIALVGLSLIPLGDDPA